jgi:hypothetical protein
MQHVQETCSWYVCLGKSLTDYEAPRLTGATFTEQSPTEPLTKPQSRLAELASIATEEQGAAYDGAVQDRGASSLDLGPLQERSESNFQGAGGPVEMDPVAMQPLMDFMTQDMSLMPFGLMDESWWRLQYGDSTMNFGM